MKLSSILRTVGVGLFSQLPIMGPVLQELLKAYDQEEILGKLQRIIELMESMQSEAAASDCLAKEPVQLISVVIAAEAEAQGNISHGTGPYKNRFLYLASGAYANSLRTCEIAAQRGFLWRSFHNEAGASIANVGKISPSDLIVLGYRSPNHFRLMLPLRVTSSGPHVLPIGASPKCHDHSPFVFPDDALSKLLLKEGYEPDAVFNRPCGLSVDVLPLPAFDASTSRVLQREFESPGLNSLWEYNHKNIPKEVADWIESL